MVDMTSILIRTLLMYVVVFVVMRLMGKREIGKLTVFDLVISVMIAEIAVLAIEDVERPLADGLVPMAALLLVQILLAYLSMKSRVVRMLFDGKPSVIVDKGRINYDVMRKQRYNLDDLMLQLRENQIASIADVEFAVLETSGKLSVIKKDDDTSTKEQGIKADEGDSDTLIPPRFRYETLPIPLIMDGKVQEESLVKLEKTRFWLKKEMRKFGITDLRDVLLCTLDHRGRLFVDRRDS
ncbi:DUF421 domain-containing protein [Paenibacillus sp. IB182496]|uniref:DUF421 domain-containing protein n=1 Tax=Paenibacillus sabuli TaxID=2772509 RepID=A0A927GQS7_9BACL|nr:DUF421 domain-containing protein [Paenibacillus sabuli]MBD2844576.1 DUF421 domain-containing protein [Paenibacillus sabuli]